MYFNTSSDNSCSFKLNLTNIIATPSTPETTEEEHLTVKDHVGSSTLRRELPQTGETNDSQKLSVIGMALMGILGLFGLGKKRKKD